MEEKYFLSLAQRKELLERMKLNVMAELERLNGIAVQIDIASWNKQIAVLDAEISAEKGLP